MTGGWDGKIRHRSSEVVTTMIMILRRTMVIMMMKEILMMMRRRIMIMMKILCLGADKGGLLAGWSETVRQLLDMKRILFQTVKKES